MRLARTAVDSAGAVQQRLPRSASWSQPHTHESVQEIDFDERADFVPPRERSERPDRRVGDSLELVRLLPVSARSYAFIKAGPKRGLFTRFARCWLELRDHVMLLMPDGPDTLVTGVFSVLGCELTTGARSSLVLRLRKRPVNRPRISTIGPASHSIWIRLACAEDAEKWTDALAAACTQRVVGVSDFEFVSPIGRGASGKVFLVRDRVSGRKLALKVIDKMKVFQNRSAFSHAVHERLALQLVAGHPFFTRLRYAFQTRSNFYLAIDFYEGGDLYQYLRTHSGRLAEPQARVVGAEVALALEHLHSLGFVYRDLKPENILLDLQGHIRLADFGLCKLLPADRLTTTVCGTHTYAAPEMLSSQPYGISVDLWALGTFLYHILRGRTPYEARDLDQVIANMNNKRIRFSSNTSPELVHLIKKLLDWSPETRFGCGRRGMDEVRNHSFFNGVDWRATYVREDNPDGLLQFSRRERMKAVDSSVGDESPGGGDDGTSRNTGRSSARDPHSESMDNGDTEENPLRGASLNSSAESVEREEGESYRGRPRLSMPNTKTLRPAATSLWDGMVAAAESNDLRNFDMAEWGKVSVDHDEDDAAYGDSSLWPVLSARIAFEDERMIAGFTYCNTSTGAPMLKL